MFINTRPATKLGVGLLAVIDGTFSGAERSGVEGLQDGWCVGWYARPEKETVRPVGQSVVNGEGRRVFGDGRRHERFIKTRPATNFAVRLSSVERRAKKGIKRTGLEGLEDGFLFGGNARSRETAVCPRRKAV